MADSTRPPGIGGKTMKSRAAEEFGRRLRLKLMQLGWSQSDLARRVFGSTTSGEGYTVAKGRDRISYWISGKQIPKAENLQALAQALDMRPEDLVSADVAENINKNFPLLSMSTIPNKSNMVHLQINVIVPAPIGVKIISIITEAQHGEAK